jgi:hypothetical protein
VHGSTLRFEPLPHKNTLGFWTRAEDWADWEFQVTRPGTFQVEALVGCGNENGGSEVEFRVANEVLKLTVPETGGFQNFVSQKLGQITITTTGRHRLEVRVVKKAKNAVMDLREVKLSPI